MKPNQEIIESKVIGYNELKKAVEIETIQFKNEHTVKYVSASKNLFPVGSKVNVFLAMDILPTFLLPENKIILKETTHSIWGIEDGEILEPLKSENNKQILFESSDDNEDGTYPLVMHYVTLVKKIESEGASAWLNRLTKNKNKLNIDYNICQIIRENKYDSNAKLIFENPIEILIETIGEKQIIEKVTEIEGNFLYDFYWTKNGRQSKYANGFEIWFNIEKYLK